MVQNRGLRVGEFLELWWERREAPYKTYVLRREAPKRIWWICAKRKCGNGELARSAKKNIPRFSYRSPPLSRFFVFWRGGISVGFWRNFLEVKTIQKIPQYFVLKYHRKQKIFKREYMFGKHIHERFSLEMRAILMFFLLQFWLLQYWFRLFLAKLLSCSLWDWHFRFYNI